MVTKTATPTTIIIATATALRALLDTTAAEGSLTLNERLETALEPLGWSYDDGDGETSWWTHADVEDRLVVQVTGRADDTIDDGEPYETVTGLYADLDADYDRVVLIDAERSHEPVFVG